MQTIKAKAYSLLARRAYFSKQLKTKLLEKGYKEQEIDKLIFELTDLGYLNDRELAVRFIKRERAKGNGRRIIALKLREKAGDLDLPMEDSLEELVVFIEKKYKKKLEEDKSKVVATLMRKGHPYDLINKALTTIQGRYET